MGSKETPESFSHADFTAAVAAETGLSAAELTRRGDSKREDDLLEAAREENERLQETEALRRAEEAAKVLMRHGVHEVFLVGRTARENEGTDTDVVAVVSEDMAEDFLSVYEHGDSYWLPEERYYTATGILGIDDEEFSDQGESLDVFLFPPDWLDRLEELQERAPHDDPDFMANIASDARKFSPKTGHFDQLPYILRRGT